VSSCVSVTKHPKLCYTNCVIWRSHGAAERISITFCTGGIFWFKLCNVLFHYIPCTLQNNLLRDLTFVTHTYTFIGVAPYNLLRDLTFVTHTCTYIGVAPYNLLRDLTFVTHTYTYKGVAPYNLLRDLTFVTHTYTYIDVAPYNLLRDLTFVTHTYTYIAVPPYPLIRYPRSTVTRKNLKI
jgi:hypothetical protein